MSPEIQAVKKRADACEHRAIALRTWTFVGNSLQIQRLNARKYRRLRHWWREYDRIRARLAASYARRNGQRIGGAK